MAVGLNHSFGDELQREIFLLYPPTHDANVFNSKSNTLLERLKPIYLAQNKNIYPKTAELG